ncbi:hypothetical protein ELI44_32895 (plasmid) [Rhizobium ruizarguesonis]|uniref:hypothetical protein n=1 Tax=Rhizobium ruizarguesonis TaxID=2081791 RepID=UPI001030BE04|nr:hypothetical protein [Rhizobium ruizarguesonis]TAU37819.1 hypothetical protein ELI42_33240 [Rhizobium ruizarguesonis]TAU51266.1 hypothetical protein ELI44_32895 [Rhizobium ruizarguesonis]
MWWNAIPFVTSGLALVAFVWAVFLTSWLAKLRTERDKVKSAPPKDRVRALEIAAEYIGVNLQDIPAGQRQVIVLQQMAYKASLQKMKIGALLFVGIVALLLVAYAAWFARGATKPPTPTTPVERVAPLKEKVTLPVQSSADVIVPPAPDALKPKAGTLWVNRDGSRGGGAKVDLTGSDVDLEALATHAPAPHILGMLAGSDVEVATAPDAPTHGSDTSTGSNVDARAHDTPNPKSVTALWKQDGSSGGGPGDDAATGDMSAGPLPPGKATTYGWVPYGSLKTSDDWSGSTDDTKSHVFRAVAEVRANKTPCGGAISEGIPMIQSGQRVKVLKIERFSCGIWQLVGDPDYGGP